jgi:ElaB/YqjD/DUF883 family membrane-anchored ribosome-binding protein
MSAPQDPGQSAANGADGSSVRNPRSIGTHVRQIRQDATVLATELQDTTTDFERFLGDHANRQPWATVGVAAAVGYVLGGGLRSRFTLVMLGVATRLAAAVAVRGVGERIAARDAGAVGNNGA